MKLSLKHLFRNDRWVTEEVFARRQYDTYDDYLDHQKSKLAKIGNLDRKRVALRAALRERIARIPEIKRGTTVLCIGARGGAECEAFIERGAFAVGIDLNPGEENRYVVVGDFHNLQYANASIECVYTNSLDHAYELERVLSEVKRVLKPAGIFIAEIVHGSRDPGGREPGKYESLWWDSSEGLITKIAQCGFVPEAQSPFDQPWNGIQVVFRV